MDQWKWFYPGLKVKRWVAMIVAGVLIFSMGFVFIVGKNIPRDLYMFMTGYVRQGVIGISSAIIGIFLAVYGAKRLQKRIFRLFVPEGGDSKLLEMLYRDMLLNKGIKVVTVGGGTGMHSLLRGLKEYTSNITAIVTVSDDGGSSGRLRDEMNIIPPGDIRQCITALADSETTIKELFTCRFESNGALKGHSVGNLLLAAMAEMKGGDFYQAIKELSKVLAVRGQVLPSTLEQVTLCAELNNGIIVRGETNISKTHSIRRVFLSPADCRALPEAIQAISEADLVLIGPGSLFTSIIPNLLVKEILSSIRSTKAPLIYICNVMSQPGETDNFSASDHVIPIAKQLGGRKIDYIVLNSRYPSRLIDRYNAEGAEPVQPDADKLEKIGIRHIVMEDLIMEDELVRHDPKKLAACIMNIARDAVPSFSSGSMMDQVEKIRDKFIQIGQ